MFERFTDPVTVVRTILARDIANLKRLINGGARLDRRISGDPWMTPMDAACATKQPEAVNALLQANVPVFGSSIYEAISADFAYALRAFHRKDQNFHCNFQRDRESAANPKLNRWLSEFTALDFAMSVNATQCAEFLEEISARKHPTIKQHRQGCYAVFIQEESFFATRGVNVDGLVGATSGFYCAKCDRFV